MEFYEILNSIMDEKDLTVADVAHMCGLTDSTVRSIVDRKQKKVALGVAFKLSSGLGVSLERLNGDPVGVPDGIPDSVLPPPKTKRIPRLGEIPCGSPALEEENFDGYADCPETIPGDYALTCRGESMSGDGIHDGDLVYIQQMPEVPNGRIAAVCINGETTLKRILYVNGQLTLSPSNPAYAPMVFYGESLRDVRVIGQAVGFTHIL